MSYYFSITIKNILGIIFFLSLIACESLTGKEVARLAINEVSEDEKNFVIKETTLDLKKGEEIGIWSDMDIAYEGGVDLRFNLELIRGNQIIGGFEVNPTDKDITVGEVKTTVMDKTEWSFKGRNTTLTIPEDGQYTFRAILISSENPSLQINKAEIILKK